jgi:dihydroflavonol-4-reductase
MVEQSLPVVLITGVSGYIGSAVCYDFLKDKSFRVRGTVRDTQNSAKIQPIKDAFGADFANLELITADLLDEASIDRAIQGADFVVHTASPCDMGGNNLKNEDEVRIPAVNGTMAVMRACEKHRVKRMVITSSVGAISLGYK